MDTTCTTDIDDIPRFPVFHSEIRRCSSYELEGCRLVYSEHSLPLFICHLSISLVSSMPIKASSPAIIASSEDLVDNPVPGEPRIVDNDVDLPTTKLRRFLYKFIDIFRI